MITVKDKLEKELAQGDYISALLTCMIEKGAPIDAIYDVNHSLDASCDYDYMNRLVEYTIKYYDAESILNNC